MLQLYSNDLQSSSRKGLEMSPRTPGRVRGGREHKCSVCGRTFNLTHHLTQHARTHTGERPFHCTICGGTFTQQSSLKRHTRGVHSGKTAAYHCTMCRSSFEERADFEEHVKIHETTQPNFYQPEPDPEAELEVPEPDNGHDEDIEEAQASEVDEMEWPYLALWNIRPPMKVNQDIILSSEASPKLKEYCTLKWISCLIRRASFHSARP